MALNGRDGPYLSAGAESIQAESIQAPSPIEPSSPIELTFPEKSLATAGLVPDTTVYLTGWRLQVLALR